MDAMKILLGATVALLLGAIFVSWQGSQKAKPGELAQLQTQFDELKEELRKSREQNGGQPAPQPQPQPQPQYTPEQIAEAQRIIDQQRAADAAKTSAANQAQMDAQLQRDEQGLIQEKLYESKDGNLKRARWISDALLVGRVLHYEDDPQFGGFITFEVLMPEQVQEGSIIGIRRNKTGILYQFKVQDISPEGAIANPVTVIGDIKPVRGDELIFPPLY